MEITQEYNINCEGRNGHLFETRSRRVFIFIAGDCTLIWNSQRQSKIITDINGFEKLTCVPHIGQN
jgi:hypothetical protein